MIDDKPSHDPRSIGHKAAPIGKGLPLARGHIKVSLVNERSGADAYLTLARELALRKAMKFRVELSKKLGCGNFITLFCQVDETRNTRASRIHIILNTAHSLSHF